MPKKSVLKDKPSGIGAGHCCTLHCTLGMMLQLGTGVLFERLPRSYLSDFGCFLQKTYATYIAEVEKKCGPNFILTPSNRVVFKGGVTFPELAKTCFRQNLGMVFPV